MTAPKYPDKFELEQVFEIQNGKLWRKPYVDSSGRNYKGCFVSEDDRTSDGYCRVRFRGRSLKYHQILYILQHGNIVGNMYIDHIDGCRTNNSLNNLRLVTKRENALNRVEHRNGSLQGSSFCKARNRWSAQIQIKGKNKFIGYYKTEQEAHKAYLEYRLNYGII